MLVVAFAAGVALAAIAAARQPSGAAHLASARPAHQARHGDLTGALGERRRIAPERELPAGGATAAQGSAQPNIDADASERGLWAEHVRLLREEPLLQLLPYRDRDLGIDLGGATRSGTPLVIVSYTGTAAAARQRLRALLAALHDAGGEYVFRLHSLAGG